MVFLLASHCSLQGKLVYSCGDVYSGSFVNGQVTGKGELVLADGSRLEGDFVAGALSGTSFLSLFLCCL